MSNNPNIVEYAAYNLSMRIQDGYYIVTLHYPQKWKGIVPDEGSTVHVVNDDSDQSVFYYMTEVDNGVDEIFELVDETISKNKELELKAALIKEKVKELEEIFIDEPYERLLNLKFVINDPEREAVDEINKEIEKQFGRSVNECLNSLEENEENKEEEKIQESESTTQKDVEQLPEKEEPTTQKQEPTIQKNIAEAKLVDNKIAEAVKKKKRKT